MNIKNSQTWKEINELYDKEKYLEVFQAVVDDNNDMVQSEEDSDAISRIIRNAAQDAGNIVIKNYADGDAETVKFAAGTAAGVVISTLRLYHEDNR